ncbi:MAG: stage III sporulation protein AB [Clostridia bacterium]|nr:stage III sporulation protein AB [Clostridia bacterium]
MLKAAAMVLLAVGFSLAGRWAAAMQKKRVSVISEILLMINVVESRLRYSHLPVSDLLRVLNENTGLSKLGFIKNCREKVCFGEPFPAAWQECVEAETELCRLLPESSKHLASFGADIGSSDLESQLSGCEYYKQIFSAELELEREKSQRYTKLFPSLGLLLGISAAIMIV